MKKLITLIMISAASLTAFAGEGNADKIYNYLEENHDVFSFSLSKKMIDFFDMDVDFNGKEKLITGDFAKGRMMVVSEKLSKVKIAKMFENEGYKMIDFESDDDEDEDNVALLIRRKGSNVAEAHFIIEEDEKLILVSVYGDMKVSDKK